MASRQIESNIEEINKKIRKIYVENPEVADEIVAKITLDILAEIKNITPIDTGNLVSNWTQRLVRKALREISNNTEYAPYVFYSSKSPHAGKIEKLFNRQYKEQIIDKIKARIKEELEEKL